MKLTRPSITIIITVVLFIIISGCNKYPEGPSISLRSAQDRLANDWIATEITRDGIDVTHEYLQFYLGIERDGGAEWRYQTFGSTIFESFGNWELFDNAKSIRFNWGLGATDEWRILRLKSQEVWFLDEQDTVNYLYKLEMR